jgi:hypothetical protein
MAERIEEEERRSIAVAEVSEALSGDTLEKQFTRLEAGDEAEGRLLALKREMGLLPPATGGGDRGRITSGDGAVQSSGGANLPAEVQEAELLEEFDRLEHKDPN